MRPAVRSGVGKRTGGGSTSSQFVGRASMIRRSLSASFRTQKTPQTIFGAVVNDTMERSFSIRTSFTHWSWVPAHFVRGGGGAGSSSARKNARGSAYFTRSGCGSSGSNSTAPASAGSETRSAISGTTEVVGRLMYSSRSALRKCADRKFVSKSGSSHSDSREPRRRTERSAQR